MKPENTFPQNLQALYQSLKNRLGVFSSHLNHPIMRNLCSAEENYVKGDLNKARMLAARVKLVLEELELIKKTKKELAVKLSAQLKKKNLPQENYFGVRCEISVAASLIKKGAVFTESETPDFLVKTPAVFGVECTSAHFKLDAEKNDVRPISKLERAIKSKNEFIFKSPRTVLVVDVTNLIFHEGMMRAKNTPILADKDKSKSYLQPLIDQTQFQSVIYKTYVMFSLPAGNGVRLESQYVRLDCSHIDTSVCKALDIIYPLGSIKEEGHLFKIN